nr:ribonuclease Z [Acinetobacter sp. Marseille-Q1620]
MLLFTFLGTSSGVPSLSRNVSGLAIKNTKNKDWMLIDAGEGTQHQIQRAKLSLQHLKVICITHVHGDHCYGLMGLLASAGMNSRKENLIIIAPKEIQTWLEVTVKLTELYLPYPIQFIDVKDILNQAFHIDEYLSIQCVSLHHRVPGYAFIITAQHVQKKLDIETLKEQSLPKGKAWGALQQGNDIEWNKQIFLSQDYVQTSIQQVQAIIAGDNDMPELLSDACKTANVLIHETTYTQAVLDKVGKSPMHCSAKMLAEFAESTSLPNLIATHLSPRYHDKQGIQTIHDEIAEFYRGHFFIANDFDQYQLDVSGVLIKL